MISSSNTAFKKTNQSGSIFTELNTTDDCTTVAISTTLQNPSTTQLQPDKNDSTSVLVSNISQPLLRSEPLCSPFLLTSATALPPLLSFSNSAIITPILVSKKSNKRNTVRTKKPKTASVIERRTRANFAKRQREKGSSKQKRPINAALSRQRRLCKHYMAIEFALEYQLNRLLSYSLIAELCAAKARPLNFEQIFENWKKNCFYLRFDKPSMNFKSIDRRFKRKHLELYRDFESVNRHSWGGHFPYDTVTTPLEKYAWSVTRVVDRKIELISGINIIVYLLEWTPHNGRTFTDSWVIEEDMDCSELVEIYERDEIARDSGFLTRGTLHSISLPVNNLRREIELKRTRFVEVEEGDVVEEEDGDEESDREIYLENESEGEESTSKRAKY